MFLNFTVTIISSVIFIRIFLLATLIERRNCIVKLNDSFFPEWLCDSH